MTPKPKSVLPEKLVNWYPGPFVRWVQPRNHRGMTITARKSNHWQHIASGGCPACDVISNIRKGVHVVLCNHVRHILGVYKRLRPNPGESFCSSGWPEHLNTPPASESPWASPGPWPGTSVVFKVNSLSFSLFPAVRQDQPVGFGLPEHNSLGTDRGVVIKCTRIPEGVGVTLWVRRGKIHNLWVKQVKPARIRKGILLRTGAATSPEPDQ